MEWLNTEKNKKKLSHAALFLLAYELLNASIIDGVKDFFIIGMNEKGYTYSDNYKNKVLPRAKHVYEASLIWLLEFNAIDKADLENAKEIRDYRNEVAHRIPEFIFYEEKKLELSYIKKATLLVHKIDNLWAKIEIVTDQKINIEEIDFQSATSMRSFILNYIISTIIPTKQ